MSKKPAEKGRRRRELLENFKGERRAMSILYIVLTFIVIALPAPSAQAVNQHVNAKQAEQPPKG